MTIEERRQLFYAEREKYKTEERENSAFREWLEKGLLDQYKEKVGILNKVGLLNILSDGEVGIVGIDGKEYPIPSFEKIKEEIREYRDVFEFKYGQGFTEIEIIPFGLPLEAFLDVLKKRLVFHNKDRGLFKEAMDYRKGERVLLRTGLDEDKPVDFNFLGFRDGGDDIFYYPKNVIGGNLVGTKKELLSLYGKSSFPGFEIVLRNDFSSLTRKDNDEWRGASMMGYSYMAFPLDYVKKIISEKEYEVGQTLEDWIVQAVIKLEKTGIILDGWLREEEISHLIGSWRGDSTYSAVPYVRWNSSSSNVEIGSLNLNGQDLFTFMVGEGARSKIIVPSLRVDRSDDKYPWWDPRASRMPEELR